MTIVRKWLAAAGVLLIVSGCGRQQPVRAKQESGPIPVRVAR